MCSLILLFLLPSVDEVLKYTFGEDTYSPGFNKNSVSTNTVEEKINTSNGNLELKIKLLSLPMRGGKDYDLYLTYRGSPLSLPGMEVDVGYNYPIKKYGYDVGIPGYKGYVEDFIYDTIPANYHRYIVSSDMGNCGLGWNVMPGELSKNADWTGSRLSGAVGITYRINGFINLNGGINYSIYNVRLSSSVGLGWFVRGKRNWKLYMDGSPELHTPAYTYFFEYGTQYPNPDYWQGESSSCRRLYKLTTVSDRKGDRVSIDWHGGESGAPPAGRIPSMIYTTTDTCHIYRGKYPLEDTTDYSLWDFYVIDSIVRNVNGEKFKVNFYYHQEWFDKILEYWYGHAFILLDSVEFLKNGQRLKAPYKFKYDTTAFVPNPEEQEQPGELIEMITPDSAKYKYKYYEYDYERVAQDFYHEGFFNHWRSTYRVVKGKTIIFPDTLHMRAKGTPYIEDYNVYYPADTIYKYSYNYGPSVGASTGEWIEVGMHNGITIWGFHTLTFLPVYSYNHINYPDDSYVRYYNIDSAYLENNYAVLKRVDEYDYQHGGEGDHNLKYILPFEREELYGLPYKIVKDYNVSLSETEFLCWQISKDVAPAGKYLETPLHPVLKYKAVKKGSGSQNLEIGDTFNLYEYVDYDKYDNELEGKFCGKVKLTSKGSAGCYYGSGVDLQHWKIGNTLSWDDLDPSDNWRIEKDYIDDDAYKNAQFYNLVVSARKYDNNNLVQKSDFEYDNNSTPRIGNLTKKTERINEYETRAKEFEYGAYGNITKITDYMGNETHLSYGPSDVFPDIITYPDNSTEDFNFDKKGRLISHTDKNGIIDQYEYDIYDRPTEYRKGSPGNLKLLGKYEYDDFRRKAKEITFNSASDSSTTIYSYDVLGRLINWKKCAADSVIMDYIYDAKGLLYMETNPRFDDISLGEATFTRKYYDGKNRPILIKYPSESGYDDSVKYIYGDDITDVYDELGEQTTLINDPSGNLIQVIDALSNQTDYYYDVNGNLVNITDAEGKETDFEYDWLGNLVWRDGPDRGIDSFAYDVNGNNIYHKLNSGDEIKFEYDVLGRIEKKIVNYAEVELYFYDDYNIGDTTYNPPSDSLDFPIGRLTGFENLRIREVYYYNEFGNLGEKQIIPLEKTAVPDTVIEDIDSTIIDIDSTFIRMDSIIDHIEYVIDHIDTTYETKGVWEIVDGSGQVSVSPACSLSGLDSIRTFFWVMPADGGFTSDFTFKLEIDGRHENDVPFSRTYTQYRTESINASGSGLLWHTFLANTAEGDRINEIGYDLDNNPSYGFNIPYAGFTLRSPRVDTSYVPDTIYYVFSVYDVDTTYSIDTIYTIRTVYSTTVLNDQMENFYYGYDLKGRLTKLETSDNYKVNYEYDKLGNISSTIINGKDTINLSSTAAGLLENIHFPGDITDIFGYTPRNWMQSLDIDQVLGGFQTNNLINVGFEYNKKGELKEKEEGAGFGSPPMIGLTTEYGYDPLGRLTTEYNILVTDTITYHSFSYDKVGNRDEVDNWDYLYYSGTNRLQDDGRREYHYDANGRINWISDGITLDYDVDGNLTQLSKSGEKYKYYYKGNQRIRQEIINNSLSDTTIFNYFHDNAGNLILEEDDSPNILENPGFETGDKTGWGQWEGDFNWVVTSQYSQEGKYSLYSPYFQTMGTMELMIQQFSLSKVKKSFTASVWVKTKNLSGGVKVMVDFWSEDWSQSYGGKSSAIITGTHNWQKISVTINPGDIPSGAVNFKFHIARMLGSGQLWVDNARCESGTERTPETKYYYAGNRLLASEIDGELHFYHLNRLGSPIMITDENGIVVKRREYEAFGNLVSSSGTLEDNREFTGKEKDPTGFHYFGARYYSGDIGRFLIPDPHTLTPAGLTLAIPQSLNPYIYCRNSPLKYVDLLGLQESPISYEEDPIAYWDYKRQQDIINQYGSGSIMYFDNPSWAFVAADNTSTNAQTGVFNEKGQDDTKKDPDWATFAKHFEEDPSVDYVDLGVSVVIITGGKIITDDGKPYYYLGISPSVSIPPGAMVMVNDGYKEPSPGLNISVQAGFVLGTQVGWGPANPWWSGFYVESGVFVVGGLGASAFIVWEGK